MHKYAAGTYMYICKRLHQTPGSYAEDAVKISEADFPFHSSLTQSDILVSCDSRRTEEDQDEALKQQFLIGEFGHAVKSETGARLD